MKKKDHLALYSLVPEEYEVWESGPNWRKHSYRFTLNGNGTVKVHRYNQPFTLIETKEQMLEILEKVKEEIEELKEKELLITDYVKTFDPTSFYDPETGILFIYSERVAFHLKRNPDEPGFGIKFSTREDNKKNSLGAGFFRAKKLNDAVSRTIQKIDERYKKNRIKLAAQGKTFDVMPKLVYKTFGNSVRSYQISTDIPMIELQNYIKKKLGESESIVETDQFLDVFKNKIGTRSKKIQGFLFGKLAYFKKDRVIYFYLKNNLE